MNFFGTFLKDLAAKTSLNATDIIPVTAPSSTSTFKVTVQSLLNLVSTLIGTSYKGIAEPSTNPGDVTNTVFFFASTPGTYTYFKDDSSASLVLSNADVTGGLNIITNDHNICRVDKIPIDLVNYALNGGSTKTIADLDAVLNRALTLGTFIDLAEIFSESSAANKFPTGDFTGWGTPIGVHTNFNTVLFKVIAQDANTSAITKVRVWITVNDKSGTVLADKTITGLNITAGNSAYVTVTFDSIITNAGGNNLFFLYKCDNAIKAFGQTGASVPYPYPAYGNYARTRATTSVEDETPSHFLTGETPADNQLNTWLKIGLKEPAGVPTQFLADQLKPMLALPEGVFTNGTVHTQTEPLKEANALLYFPTGAFSGWGTPIGVQKNISAVQLKIYPQDANASPVTAVRVWITTNDKSGTVLVNKKITGLSIAAGSSDYVTVTFDSIIENATGAKLFLSVKADQNIKNYGQQGADIPFPYPAYAGFTFSNNSTTVDTATPSGFSNGNTDSQTNFWFKVLSEIEASMPTQLLAEQLAPMLVNEDEIDTTGLKQLQGLWAAFNKVNIATTLQAAINSVTGNLNKQYEINVNQNYSFKTLDDYPSPNGSYYFIANTKNYVNIRGVGARKKLYAELPTNATLADYTNHQTVLLDGSARLENLHIIAKNIRYPIHSDRGSSAGNINENAVQRVINCIVEHMGIDENIPSGNRWATPSGWGGGTSSGEIVELINSTFISPIYPVSNHSNSDFTNPTLFRIINCKLINTAHGYGLNIQTLGSGQKEVYEIIGTYIGGPLHFSRNWFNSLNRNDVNTLIPRITGYGNNPVFYDNVQAGQSGRVLKITSGTTGTSSTIRVTGGTAKDLIYGIETYKDGAGAMPGWAYGNIEIGDISMGNASQYLQSLGHRLGDCSSVNKTLIISVDGVTKTVTFNKNYSGGTDKSVAPAYSNATILAEINAVITPATADTFNLVDEYYPEFTDHVMTCYNASTSGAILKGMGVMIVGYDGVRKAVSGEKPDGIALDDIMVSGISNRPDDTGRILRRGYLNKSGRFSFLWDGATPTFAVGDKIKIGSTDGCFIKDSTGVTAATAITTSVLKFNL